MREDTTDWTYRDALAAAQPRIERLSLAMTAQGDQINAAWRDIRAALAAWWHEARDVIARLWGQIVAWALSQGPAPELSPALVYMTPSIRRRMAKRRARMVTRYARIKGDAHAR